MKTPDIEELNETFVFSKEKFYKTYKWHLDHIEQIYDYTEVLNLYNSIEKQINPWESYGCYSLIRKLLNLFKKIETIDNDDKKVAFMQSYLTLELR